MVRWVQSSLSFMSLVLLIVFFVFVSCIMCNVHCEFLLLKEVNQANKQTNKQEHPLLSNTGQLKAKLTSPEKIYWQYPQH